MTTPFSRSIRILDADKFRPSLLIIGFAIVILVIWLLWLTLARITLLETGQIIHITPVGAVEAEFKGKNNQRIKAGQPGLLTITGEAGDNLGLISAIVVARHATTEEGTIRVDLLIIDDRFFSLPISDEIAGQVKIEVDRVSPLQLFLRSSGQFSGAPKVSTSSQPTQK